jgi:hypothetical protein
MKLAGAIRDRSLKVLCEISYFVLDTKLRACDVVRATLEDIAPHGRLFDRVTMRQKEDGAAWQVQTRQSLDGYIRVSIKKAG